MLKPSQALSNVEKVFEVTIRATPNVAHGRNLDHRIDCEEGFHPQNRSWLLLFAIEPASSRP